MSATRRDILKTIHALTDAEFIIAAKEAGYVGNDDPCDIPGKSFRPQEDAICAYINASAALHAEAIAIALDDSPAWGPPPRRARLTTAAALTPPCTRLSTSPPPDSTRQLGLPLRGCFPEAWTS